MLYNNGDFEIFTTVDGLHRVDLLQQIEVMLVKSLLGNIYTLMVLKKINLPMRYFQKMAQTLKVQM